MAQHIMSTEVWNRKNGKVAKAVLRTAKGTFLGATNQSSETPVKGKVSRPRVTVVGR